MRKVLFCLTMAATLLNSCSKSSSSGTPTPTGDTYFPQVKAIIQANCMTCHNSAGTWLGRPTRFDTDSLIAAQHSAIKAAVADPVTPTNHRMPQVGQLDTASINIIIQWNAKGGGLTD